MSAEWNKSKELERCKKWKTSEVEAHEKELSKDNLRGFRSTCGAYSSYPQMLTIIFTHAIWDWLFTYVHRHVLQNSFPKYHRRIRSQIWNYTIENSHAYYANWMPSKKHKLSKAFLPKNSRCRLSSLNNKTLFTSFVESVLIVVYFAYHSISFSMHYVQEIWIWTNKFGFQASIPLLRENTVDWWRFNLSDFFFFSWFKWY